jgi:hypothetical protein
MVDNQSWNLESFIESLIYELDRTQDMLALKGFDQRITYTVEDMALDLQLFPVYTGDTVLFSTARPGETGASTVSIKLGSITDRQIRETARPPVRKEDVAVSDLKDLDDDTKKTLTRIGVRSVKDIQTMEERDVDLARASGKRLNYARLADEIARVRRSTSQPRVHSLSLVEDRDGYVLSLSGQNLLLDESDLPGDFPMALVNQEPARVIFASPDEIQLSLRGDELQRGDNALAIALDPYAVIRMNLKA